MQTGEFDGSDRDHFFQGVIAQKKTARGQGEEGRAESYYGELANPA